MQAPNRNKLYIATDHSITLCNKKNYLQYFKSYWVSSEWYDLYLTMLLNETQAEHLPCMFLMQYCPNGYFKTYSASGPVKLLSITCRFGDLKLLNYETVICNICKNEQLLWNVSNGSWNNYIQACLDSLLLKSSPLIHTAV